jgi:hypothetical protein
VEYFRLVAIARAAIEGDIVAKTLKRKIWRAASKIGVAQLYDLAKYRIKGEGIPPVGSVRFGDFRRLEPMSREYGFDRGGPVDRYYIEKYLGSQKHLIKGRVLEIGERLYTDMFGQGVEQSDMLHVVDHPDATYVDDLTDGETIPSNIYDCVILTQTLHLIFDMRKAVQTLFRILKPGGVVLCTVPGITQIADSDWNDTWYWSLSRSASKKLFETAFQPGYVDVSQFGNVLAATSFLQGLGAQELNVHELDYFDEEYPIIIGICARAGTETTKIEMSDRWDYAGQSSTPYDEETSYRIGLEFLDGQGETVEDWGCGTAYAKRFVGMSRYVGIDGSDSDHADVKAELQEYKSQADCIFMRHVLEHNWGWRQILANAVASFQKRMVLIVFTPFTEGSDEKLGENGIIPDLSLNKAELLGFFPGLKVREQEIKSATEYGVETIFFLEK